MPAWAAKLPTSDQNRPSRPSVVTAKLVDLWNNSFFAPRSIEDVLFKGHKQRSGPYICQIERNLPGFDSDADSSDSLSSDDLSGSNDKYGRGAGHGYYGGSYPDSKQRKAERKAEKKHKNKEKKACCRAREHERAYALYISCVDPRDGALGAPY